MFRKPKTYACLALALYVAGVLIVGSSHAQYRPPSGGGGSAPGGSNGDVQMNASGSLGASIINALAGVVTFTVPASTAGPVVTCAAASSTSSGSGSNAPACITVTGAVGQATTFADPASTGGSGGGLALAGGVGGANSDSDATSSSLHRAGFGGAVSIRSGVGGAGGGTGHARGGGGGSVSVLGANGGNSAHDNGGAGGSVTVASGTGGASLTTATGGAGGSVFLGAGDGGDTSGGTNGTGGSVTVDAGNAGSGGTGGAGGAVSIGTSAAASVTIGQSGVTTNIRGNVSMPNAVSQPYLTLGGQAYGPLSAITPPPLLSALTWVNQGGATAVQNVGGNAILMSVPSGSGDSIRYLHTAAYPTTPYTFTIGFKLWMPNSDFQGHGIAISDGTKFAGFGLGHNSVTGAVAYTFATATSDGATIGGIPITAILASNEWYVSITDDGTTITVKQGPDPLVMVTIGSATRSTLGITPTQVGIYMDCRNASLTAQALFFHWKFT